MKMYFDVRVDVMCRTGSTAAQWYKNTVIIKFQFVEFIRNLKKYIGKKYFYVNVKNILKENENL